MKNKQYNIVVLDYALTEVRFFSLKKEPADVEDWLEKHDERWKDSQCYWMGTHAAITERHFVE